MSNYFEYNNKMAFHPGYYIKEIVDEIGISQEDFAKRLDTTPKNLSLLIRGEQRLTPDIAMKLSRMLGTSMKYWLNLQDSYDEALAERKMDEELKKEKEILKLLNYNYFRENFNLPDLKGNTNKQVEEIRKFLKVSSLTVFSNRDMTVSFRSAKDMNERNIVKANIMVQIAINKAIRIEAPKYDKKKFEECINYALSLTNNYDNFYPLLFQSFLEAGVIFIILPNLPGSKTNGASKKIGDKILIMVNDRRSNSDTFWFTLFHEIGHVLHGDYGITFENSVENEKLIDKYAENKLIPEKKYIQFIKTNKFDAQSITSFASAINRNPAIVLGRLENDGYIQYTDQSVKELRRKLSFK